MLMLKTKEVWLASGTVMILIDNVTDTKEQTEPTMVQARAWLTMMTRGGGAVRLLERGLSATCPRGELMAGRRLWRRRRSMLRR